MDGLLYFVWVLDYEAAWISFVGTIKIWVFETILFSAI